MIACNPRPLPINWPASLVHCIPDLPTTQRRYWLRAHKQSVARRRRLSAVYEAAWRSGRPAWHEWEQLQTARTRERFCYALLCLVMDWR